MALVQRLSISQSLSHAHQTTWEHHVFLLLLPCIVALFFCSKHCFPLFSIMRFYVFRLYALFLWHQKYRLYTHTHSHVSVACAQTINELLSKLRIWHSTKLLSCCELRCAHFVHASNCLFFSLAAFLCFFSVHFIFDVSFDRVMCVVCCFLLLLLLSFFLFFFISYDFLCIYPLLLAIVLLFFFVGF